MSIKNAFKLLLNRFGIVGELLLFLVIFFVVVCALGAIYVQPIIQAAVDLNLNETIVNFYTSILSSNLENILENFKAVLVLIRKIFIGDNGIIFKTTAMPILFFITFSLLSNMYELALCKVLEARMSSNAKISLLGNIISLSGKSALYVLVKLIFITITDTIILIVMIASSKLLVLSSVPLLIPFVELLILLIFISLKKCFTVTWIQEIVMGENKIFVAFGKSCKSGFSHFRLTFPCYFISLLLLFVLNGLMALLTFGVGLIVSIPVSILFLKILEMTAYYSFNGKRYYLDGNTIVGPNHELTGKLD